MPRSKTRKPRPTAKSASSAPAPTLKTPRSRAARRAASGSSSPRPSATPKQSVIEYEILPVRPDLVPAVWPHIEPILQRAIDECHDRITAADVLEATQEADYLIWLVTDPQSGKITAVFTTRIIAYPRRSALAIDLVAGSQLSRWIRMALHEIERHALRLGCDLIEGYGRPAWGRVLAADGWGPAYMTYTKVLRFVPGQRQSQPQPAADDDAHHAGRAAVRPPAAAAGLQPR